MLARHRSRSAMASASISSSCAKACASLCCRPRPSSASAPRSCRDPLPCCVGVRTRARWSPAADAPSGDSARPSSTNDVAVAPALVPSGDRADVAEAGRGFDCSGEASLRCRRSPPPPGSLTAARELLDGRSLPPHAAWLRSCSSCSSFVSGAGWACCLTPRAGSASSACSSLFRLD